MSVRIEGLIKKYGNVTAVNGVSLEIKKGEFVTLLGESGCGKTTTLRTVAGLERPDGGEIYIGDKLVAGSGAFVPPEKRDLGMIFQSYAIWPHMTVFENVAYGLRIKGFKGAEMERRVKAGLELVGLAEYGSRLATDLSGGQQQRVAVARSVVIEPSVLLFDEPLSNLDAKLRERMRFEIRSLQKKLGVTSLYVTHDQAEAMAISDRVVVMQGGKIVQAGTPREIYDRPASVFVADFIGLINLFKARDVSAGQRSATIQTEHGQAITAPVNGHPVTAGGSVGFRPENVKLLSEEHAAEVGVNVWPVKVTSLAFLGNLMDLVVDWGGRPVRVQLPPADCDQAVLDGGSCFAHVPVDRVITIPAS